MLIHQAEKLQTNNSVYDILHREYRIIGYRFKYTEGKLTNIFLEIKGDFGIVSSVDSKYLYTSLDELSDPEKLFYKFTQTQKKNLLPLYSMPLDQLNEVLIFYTQGFYDGYNIASKDK